MTSPNPNWAPVYVQVAFNADPNNPAVTPTWIDLTNRVDQLHITRGRQYELDQVQAGEATVTFRDPDEWLNPANPASPYWPHVQPYRRISIQAVAPAPAGGGTNLFNTIDPGYEATPVGGYPPGVAGSFLAGPLQVTNALAWQGTHSATFGIITGPGSQQGITWWASTIPGQQYTFSLYLNQTAANAAYLGVATSSANPAAGYSTSSTPTSAVNTWVRLSVTFVASQPTSYLWVYWPGTVSTAATVYVDGVQLEQAAAPSPWSTTGPTIYPLFAGHVERWPASWDHAGNYGLAEITCVDPLGILAAQTLHTEIINQHLAYTPDHYWPLWDQHGATYYDNLGTNTNSPLGVYTSPYGPGGGLSGATSEPVLPGDNGGNWVTFTPGSGLFSQVPEQFLAAGPIGPAVPAPPIPAIPANPAGDWAVTVSAFAAITHLADSAPVNVPVDGNGIPLTGTQQRIVSLLGAPAGTLFQNRVAEIGLIGTNLLYYLDTSFEQLPAGSTPESYWAWYLVGSPTISTARVFQGSQSLAVPISGGSGNQGVRLGVAGLTAGQQYTFSIQVNQTVGNTVEVGVTGSATSPPPSFDTTGTFTTSANTWTTLFVTFDASAAIQYVWIWCLSPPTSATIYLDTYQLETGPTVSSWSPYCYMPAAVYRSASGAGLLALPAAGGGGVNDGRPRHYAAVVSQTSSTTTLTLYVNGSQTATGSAATNTVGGMLPAGATLVEVGGSAVDGGVGGPWTGQIAHVAVWASALDAGHFDQLYYVGATGFGPEPGGPYEYSGQRIARWLGYLYTPSVNVDTGASMMDTSNIQRGTFALDACNGVVLSEGGVLYADRAGVVQFKARTARFTATTPRWVFGEQEVPYGADITYNLDPQQVFNDVTVTRTGGSFVGGNAYLNYVPGAVDPNGGTVAGIQVRVVDFASQAAYGNRQMTAEIGIASDQETVDHANYWLNRYRQPVQRLAALTLNPAANPALWPTVLGMELGDRATVRRRPRGVTMAADFFVERIEHTIKAGDGTWTTAIQASPVDRQQVWLIGDATFGQVGVTTVLGY